MVVALAAGALLGAPRSAAAQNFVVIVNAGNSATSLPRGEVAALFLKQVTTWPDGSTVTVVDLPERAPARAAFSRTVIGRTSGAVAAYWQQQVFTGRGVPPTQRTSDAEIVAFVRTNANAIGYVAKNTPLGDGVKPINIISR